MSELGHLTPAELTIVQRGTWQGRQADVSLENAAAGYLLTMFAAYAAETGRHDAEIAEPAGGYRDAETLLAMQQAFHAMKAGDTAAGAYWNLDPSSNAVPSLSSPHGSGLCADIYGLGFQWFIDNSPRFGFKRTLVSSGDIHHFQYFPGTATAALDQSAINNLQEDDMGGSYALEYTVAGPELPADVKIGAVFVGSGTEPLIWAGNWGPEQLNGVVPAPWNAQLIAQRINEVGIRGTGVNLNMVFASLADAMAGKNPVYILGAAPGAGGLSAADILKAAGAALLNG